jgi:hypothetical protein
MTWIKYKAPDNPPIRPKRKNGVNPANIGAKGIPTQKVFAYMKKFFLEHDRLPTAMDVAKVFGIRSMNASYHHFRKLHREGYLEKDGWRYKFAKAHRP